MNAQTLLVSIAAVIGACAALAAVAVAVAPSESKVAAAVIAIAITLAVFLLSLLTYKYFAPLRKWLSQGIPAVKQVGISFVVPLSSFFLLGRSWESAVFGAVIAAFILSSVFLARDRRQIYPFPNTTDDLVFRWMGIGGDQVGMGPGGLSPDKHPDAVFSLEIRQDYDLVKQVTVKRLSRDGSEAGQVWTTRRHPRNWSIGLVTESGTRVNVQRQDDLNLATKDCSRVFLHISDVVYIPSGWFLPGQKYLAEVTYAGDPVDFDVQYHTSIP